MKKERTNFLVLWPAFAAQPTLVEDLTKETPKCDAQKLKPEELEVCESYITWSQCIAGVGGIVLTVAEIVKASLNKAGKKELASDIWDGFGALYKLFYGVNQEFLMAISDINAGKPFEPIESPGDLPDWPDDDKKASDAEGIIEGVWNTLKPILEFALKKLPKGSKWEIVLSGLIDGGENALKKLRPLLKKAFGS